MEESGNVSVRFTAYLSQEERAALAREAKAHSCSENFIVRLAVRNLLFRTPIPSYLQHELEKGDPK